SRRCPLPYSRCSSWVLFFPEEPTPRKHRTAPALRTVNRDMSYVPSHRMPPSQERWPAATPAEGWPSYRDGEQDDFGYAAQAAAAGNRYQPHGAVATAAYPAVTNGYGGYAGAADDFDGRDGYRRDGY